MRDPDQDGQNDVVRDQRRAAVGHKRKGHAGKRQNPKDAADDDKRLETEQRSETGGQQCLKRRPSVCSHPKAGSDKKQEGDQHRGCSEQAEFLTKRRKDHVRSSKRNLLWCALTETGAGHPTIGHGERCFGNLETRPFCVLVRIDPDVHPTLDVGEQAPRNNRAHAEHDKADEHIGSPGGRHVEHHNKQGEQQQRRTKVPLRDHHHQRDPQRKKHGGKVFCVRDVERSELAGRHGQQLAFVRKVASEETGEHDLGKLAGLYGERTNPKPDPGAVDLNTKPRHQRQEEQPDTGQGQRVAVRGKLLGITQQQQHHAERPEPDEGPRGLTGR